MLNVILFSPHGAFTDKYLSVLQPGRVVILNLQSPTILLNFKLVETGKSKTSMNFFVGTGKPTGTKITLDLVKHLLNGLLLCKLVYFLRNRLL